MEHHTRRIYVARHGQTAWNRDMRFQGHTDIPLEAEGREQARRSALRLADEEPLEAIWTSDLSRARETAQAIADLCGLAVRTTPLLRETRLGEWEGMNRAEIEARGEVDRLALYTQDPFHHPPPGGETMDEAYARILHVAEMIRAEHPSGHLVIVGHGGSLRALLCHALDAPVTSMRRMRLNNASLSIIEEQQTPNALLRRLALLNDTSHL